MTVFSLHPRLEVDSFFVADLPLCQLRLQNETQMPWLILEPRRANMREIIDLSEEDQQQLLREIGDVSKMLRLHFAVDKLNVAALGNIVPQLHIHVIARRINDAAWPNPVWGHFSPKPFRNEELAATVGAYRAMLKHEDAL